MKYRRLCLFAAVLVGFSALLMGCNDSNDTKTTTVNPPAAAPADKANTNTPAPAAEAQQLINATATIAAHGIYGSGDATVPGAGTVHGIVVTENSLDITGELRPLPDTGPADSETGSDIDLSAACTAGQVWRIIMHNNNDEATPVGFSITYEP